MARDIGEDELVVVFSSTGSLIYYRLFCWKADSPKHHLKGIDDVCEAVEEWQKDNHIQTPRSDSLG